MTDKQGIKTRLGARKNWDWSAKFSDEDVLKLLLKHLRDNGHAVPNVSEFSLDVDPYCRTGGYSRGMIEMPSISIRASGIGDPPEMSTTEPASTEIPVTEIPEEPEPAKRTFSGIRRSMTTAIAAALMLGTLVAIIISLAIAAMTLPEMLS